MDSRDLETAFETKDWSSILKRFRESEIRQKAENDQSLPFSYAYLMLGHMLQNEIKNAHFVWKRIPDTVRISAPYLTKIWELGKYLTLKDRKSFYEAVDRTRWPREIAPFVAALRADLQQKMSAFILRAYESIQLNKVAELLGMDEEQAKRVTSDAFWKMNGAMVYPSTSRLSIGEEAGLPLTELGHLSKYIAEFELK